jgi:branched-chain amino acid transport system substrate-binding protein
MFWRLPAIHPTREDFMKSSLRNIMFALPLLGAALNAAAEEGVTNDRIYIGQTIGVTGQIAGPVKELTEGAKAYISMINRNGGVHGRKVEIITLDDKFDPATAAKNVDKLIKENHVFALFQCRGTPHTEAILPIMMAAKVPLVAPSTGAAVFHAPVNPLLFNVRAKYQDEVIKAVEQFSTVGIRKIGLIHVDDSFGRDALAGFNKAMETYKLKPAVVMKFDRAKPDVEKVVQSVISADPHTAIIVASATTTIDIIKSLRSKGSRTQLMTLSNNSSDSFIKNLGKDAPGIIVSQITPAPDLLSSKLGQEFKVAAKASGATVSYAAMEGFVSAKVLIEGLERAGKDLTRAKFVHALETIQKEDFGGLMVTYGPDRHTGSEFVELTMINRNGRFIR